MAPVRAITRLENFQQTNRYTDVTVECADGTFRCHRLILAATSDYFDAMFGGAFQESSAKSISLPTINAATFEQVLKYVYTGEATVSAKNVCSLLEAGELMQLSDIEEMCVEFAQKNRMTVQNTLDMFAFARKTNKKTLIDVLGSCIADQFDIFSKVDRFREIPFDDLKCILNRCSSPNAESLLGAITRWICHDREGRLQHFEALVNVIKFEDVSPAYVKIMFGKFMMNSPNLAALTQIDRPVGYDDVSELPKTVSKAAETALHVFVKHEEEKLMRVFSTESNTGNSSTNWSISTEVHQTDDSQWVRSVSHGCYLYCLNYFRQAPSQQKDANQKQTFCAYTSVRMHEELRLKTPPLVFEEVQMCALQNNIYVYNECIFSADVIRTESPAFITFNDVELKRGIYLYNTEVDNWLPVPRMKIPLKESSMVACDGTLYLIGGLGSNERIPSGYVQAYDYRIGTWRKLTRTHYLYTGAASCVIEGKIYVCGGRLSGYTQCERYDPVAGKWEKRATMNKGMSYHRATCHLNRLWAMGRYKNGVPSNDFSIEVYNPKLNLWYTDPSLLQIKEAMAFSGAIMEEVVF